MSDVIRRAAARLVRSQQFLQTFTELVAVEMERQLRAEAGGENIYVAKTTSMVERRERDRLIRECFTGSNINFLAGRFGLSPQHIRRIVAKKSNIGG
jgi:Mor family transcriptional regulator